MGMETDPKTCDPCELARLGRGTGSDDLDLTRCIMVDDSGRAQYMVITEDGRWIPAESY